MLSRRLEQPAAALRTVQPLRQLGRPRRTDAAVSDAATCWVGSLWPAILRPAKCFAVEWSGLQGPIERRIADARPADDAAVGHPPEIRRLHDPMHTTQRPGSKWSNY